MKWLEGAAWVLFVGMLVLWANVLMAQDHHRWHQYYQHWKQPGTEIGCCNARVIGPEGQTLAGDCEPTRWKLEDGYWWAWVRQESRWIKIPDDRIIKERNPSVEEAHLCYSEYTKSILCFVPPDTGG